jgi:hypothetical protein
MLPRDLLGRGLRRIIAMFYSVRDLVGESDRRAELEASGEDTSYTDEYVLFADSISLLLMVTPLQWQRRSSTPSI